MRYTFVDPVTERKVVSVWAPGPLRALHKAYEKIDPSPQVLAFRSRKVEHSLIEWRDLPLRLAFLRDLRFAREES